MFALSATGGTRPYKWEVLAGGVTINADTGILTGSFSDEGSHTVVVRVTDKDGNSVIANVVITVTKPAT